MGLPVIFSYSPFNVHMLMLVDMFLVPHGDLLACRSPLAVERVENVHLLGISPRELGVSANHLRVPRPRSDLSGDTHRHHVHNRHLRRHRSLRFVLRAA
jgi:hypothetical protein